MEVLWLSRLKNKTPNIPKASLEDYFVIIAGPPSCGKTALVAEVFKKHYGGIDKGLLLAYEKNYSHLQVIAEDVQDWEDGVEIVDELIFDKDDLPYKVVSPDTLDRMVAMAQKAVVKDHNSKTKNPAERVQSIDDFDGYEKGAKYKSTAKLVTDELDRIRKAGYGIIATCHVKEEVVNNEPTGNLLLPFPESIKVPIVNLANLIVIISVDKKTGDRTMHFRGHEAKSHFYHMPKSIPYDIDKFLETFEEAIQKQLEDIGIENITPIKQEQKREKDQKAKEFIEQQKELKTKQLKEEQEKAQAEVLQDDIEKHIKTLEKDIQKEVATYFRKTYGSSAFKKNYDIEQLEKMLEYVKQK